MKKRTITLIIALAFVIGGAAIAYYLLGLAENAEQQGAEYLQQKYLRIS